MAITITLSTLTIIALVFMIVGIILGIRLVRPWQ